MLKQVFYYGAEISCDNTALKAFDGSIYSIDGGELVRARISMNGFTVPQGTRTVREGALYDVHGSVRIPESVEKIEDVYGFGRNVKTVITPKGSFAEWYVLNHKRTFHIEIVMTER